MIAKHVFFSFSCLCLASINQWVPSTPRNSNITTSKKGCLVLDPVFYMKWEYKSPRQQRFVPFAFNAACHKYTVPPFSIHFSFPSSCLLASCDGSRRRLRSIGNWCKIAALESGCVNFQYFQVQNVQFRRIYHSS